MLRKYVLHIREENKPEDILFFLGAVNKMKYYKQMNKDVVKFFWGMRGNWFPLCLMRLCLKSHGIVSEETKAARQLFIKLMRDKNSHSWYIDKVEEYAEDNIEECGGYETHTWMIYFRTNDSKIDYIDAIMRLYHLRYEVQCL